MQKLRLSKLEGIMLLFDSRKYIIDSLSVVSQSFVKCVSCDSLWSHLGGLHFFESSEKIQGLSKKSRCFRWKFKDAGDTTGNWFILKFFRDH